MPELPRHPSLDHLRREAKRLLRRARAGDADAVGDIRAFSESLTLAAAQLATARTYGFSSWTRLKEEVDLRALNLADKARQFVRASVGDKTGPAVRMLAETPELARYSFATTVVLGDAAAVSRALSRDAALAKRHDTETGWTPLHLVCSSRWHTLDPKRTPGLVEVARLLLDAGADLNERIRPGARTPLACACATASTSMANELLLRLLLERGGTPEDQDLYMAGFAPNATRTLGILVAHMRDLKGTAQVALAAPISKRDKESLRLLLEAGADPRRYHNDNGEPASAVQAAIDAGCDEEIVELLTSHGADVTGIDVPAALGTAAAQRAAETGDVSAIRDLLKAGLRVDSRIGGYDATLLHLASYSGSNEVVRILLESNADVGRTDRTWNSTPLGWAVEGFERRVATNLRPDWATTVSLLIDAGASVEGFTIPDELKLD